MPSGRCQADSSSAAQLKILMFGYLAQACSRSSFQVCILASDHGPAESSVCVLTHMTGWPCAALIISSILAIRLTFDPTDTLAVSLVPSAKTKQPRKPLLSQARATL